MKQSIGYVRVSPCAASLICLLLSAGCAPPEDPATPAVDELSTSGIIKITRASASTNDGNVAGNAVDGNMGTRWSGLGMGASLTADFGGMMSVRSLDLAWYRGDQRRTTFDVAVSSDGSSFRTVYSGSSSGTTASFESYDLPDTTARYLKVVSKGNTDNLWASLSELQVYGTPAVTHLFSDSFTGTDRLLANEYAYWHPTASGIVTSSNWEMNSGSLFSLQNTAWSGVPDGAGPNIGSTNGTDSSVFRMMSKRADFGDVAVSFSLKNDQLVTTSRTPQQDWDGIHFWMRYQAENSMYYASINRRDNTVILKKKVPGGPTNGGTYYNMTSSIAHTVPYGAWQKVKTTAKNNADGSVTISLYAEGVLVASATDTGLGGPPIRAPGKVGIRGDNCNFRFDDFTVDAL